MPIVFFGLIEEVEGLCTSAIQELKKNPKIERLKIFRARKPFHAKKIKDIILILGDIKKCAHKYLGQRFKSRPLHEVLNDKLLSDLWTFADTMLLIASIYGHTAMGHLDDYHMGIESFGEKIIPRSVAKAGELSQQSLRGFEISKKLLVKRYEICRLFPKQKK